MAVYTVDSGTRKIVLTAGEATSVSDNTTLMLPTVK